MWNLSSPSRNGLCPLRWEHGVLTTRLPGKSHKWLIINIDSSENKNLSVLEGTLVVIQPIPLFYPGKDCHRVLASPRPHRKLPCNRGRAGNQGPMVFHKALSHVFSHWIFTTTYPVHWKSHSYLTSYCFIIGRPWRRIERWGHPPLELGVSSN